MKKKMMSSLPDDLTEEVLCRIPLTSLRSVRSTCKKWKTLCKDRSFAKKHLGQSKVAEEAKEIMVVMMKDYRVYLMSFNISNNNNFESCIKREGELIAPYDSDQIDDVSKVFHCDGLLLCIMKDNTRLVVWNPYSGETRWIVPTHKSNILDMYYSSYALGYDKSSKSHKILRFVDHHYCPAFFEFKIYDFNSDSWRVLDPPQDWRIKHYHRGLTLKGNTYWFATEKYSETEFDDCFLVCFDFTIETFGPRLPLPFDDPRDPEDTVSLSSVREEQLAVLFQRSDTLRMEIWVTAKVEPNAVSWNSKVFLSANIKQLIHPQFHFPAAMSFFIDEEKKVAVVFDKDKDIGNPIRRDVAYIIRLDGSLREANVGEAIYKRCVPIVCSYVPSLVQLL